MSNIPNKPTLEDLLASKKLSNSNPQCWTKFDEEVKIKTLESLHKGNSFNTTIKILPLFVVLLLPIFVFHHAYFSDNEHITTEVSTSGAANDLVVAETSNLTELAEDLTITAIEFADNTYNVSTSEEFELSYALENLESPETTFVTTAIDLEENRRTDLLSNFAF